MKSDKSREAIELVKQRISGVENGFDGRAVLLFSGGRDSSAVAAAFCRAFPNSELHLLLIDNGLLSRIDSTERQASLMKNLFPDVQIVFSAKRVSQMMRKAGMQQIEKDFLENGFSTLLICLACKLIMNVSAIRYAKEQGIKIVMDGFAERQKLYPEQTAEFMEMVRKIYKDSGLSYVSPLYDFWGDKATVNQALAELGVYIQKQEPVCMFGDSFSTAKAEEIVRYTEKTFKLIREFNPLLKA